MEQIYFMVASGSERYLYFLFEKEKGNFMAINYIPDPTELYPCGYDFVDYPEEDKTPGTEEQEENK